MGARIKAVSLYLIFAFTVYRERHGRSVLVPSLPAIFANAWKAVGAGIIGGEVFADLLAHLKMATAVGQGSLDGRKGRCPFGGRWLAVCS
uniref:Uncharacterized protein n=1 Tax=Trichuris muris TaxID=70415 RepID=A0A5S6QK00_TRIMR